MKTIQEWFNELPSPIREKALANLKPNHASRIDANMASAIMYGLTWADTPEESTYWSVLHQCYCDGKPIPESYFPAKVDNTIVQLYNGNYALLRNCVTLTKGQYDGEYCLKANAVKLYDNHWCTTEDEVITDNRDRTVLESDIDRYDIVWSDYEGGYYDRDDVVFGWVSRRSEDYFKSDDYICCNDHCYLDEDVANSHDIYYDNHYEEYRHSDDMWVEEDEEEESSNTESYHSMSRKDLRTKSGWSIGFEVEKEDEHMVEVGNPYDIHRDTGWCKEKDGSLNDRIGFEMVSPTFSLYDSTKILNSFDSVKDYINANTSNSCGGHIHIGHNDYSPDEIFNGLAGYFPLFYSMYEHRLNIDYCKAKKKKELAWKKEKYSAIYVRDVTVEFRIISRVKNVSNLKWRLELMQIICEGFGKSELQVIKDMVSKRSKLHKHLLKVYSFEQICGKVNKFIEYSRKYNDSIITGIKPMKVTMDDCIHMEEAA